jgi:hypothetical protein
VAELDDLARRAVDVALRFARRAGRLAVVTGLFIAFVGLVTYAIGRAALDGGADSAWTIIGAVLVIVAVGAPLLAWWRLATVRRYAGELADDVRRLIAGDAEAKRIVIDTVEAGEPSSLPPPGTAQTRMLVTSQSFSRLRTVSISTGGLRRLPGAVNAVTSFPGLLALGLLLSLVLSVLGFVFLLVWIF